MKTIIKVWVTIILGLFLVGFVGIKLLLVDGSIQAIYAAQATPIDVNSFVWGVARALSSGFAIPLILMVTLVAVHYAAQDPL